MTGKLFLDREPRTTHLRSSTIEKEEERARLPDWLEETYASLDLITNRKFRCEQLRPARPTVTVQSDYGHRQQHEHAYRTL